MANPIDPTLVWTEIKKNLFAVIGMVTGRGESRTSGIVYIVHKRKFYIGVGKESWKARHIAANPSVSLTIPIHKSVPLMPWMKIPPATITLCGNASVLPPADVDPTVLNRLYRGRESDPRIMDESLVLVIEPSGDFVTYGVGVSLLDMRDGEKARGRAPAG